jgi:hypothetical protein
MSATDFGFPEDPKDMTDAEVCRMLIILAGTAHDSTRLHSEDFDCGYLREAFDRAITWGLNNRLNKEPR